MADKTFNLWLPPLKAVDLLDGTYAMAASLVAGTNIIGGILGRMALVSVEKTRPDNTTLYAANDVLSESAVAGTVWTFPNVVDAVGKSGYIVLAKALYDSKKTPRLRLHLYSAAPTSALDDNVPNTSPLYADAANWIGTIDLDAAGDGSTDGVSGGSDTVQSIRDDLRLQFKCDAASRDIIAVVETLDTFTPVALANLTITLGVEQVT